MVSHPPSFTTLAPTSQRAPTSFLDSLHISTPPVYLHGTMVPDSVLKQNPFLRNFEANDEKESKNEEHKTLDKSTLKPTHTHTPTSTQSPIHTHTPPHVGERKALDAGKVSVSDTGNVRIDSVGSVNVSGRQEVGTSKPPSSSPVSRNSLKTNPVPFSLFSGPFIFNPEAIPFEGKLFCGQSDRSSDTKSKQSPPAHEAGRMDSLTFDDVLGSKVPITGLELAQMWEAEADADRYPTSGMISEPKKGHGLTSL